jgi:hypothetical protein
LVNADRAGLHALVVGFGTPSSSGWPSALDALRRVLPD